MDLKDVEWATIDECAHALASKPRGLPKDRVKQELLEGVLRGAISFRFEGQDWVPDDFKEAAIGVGGNSEGWAELRIAGDDSEALTKLMAVRWQDYGEFFRRVYLDRFELATKSVLEFHPQKKARAGAKRGRPPKYAWKRFHDEVVAQLEYEGAFDPSVDPSWTQAALERKMLGWCINNWGKHPSESLIREHVKLASTQAGK